MSTPNVRFGILLTCGKQLHDYVSSPRRHVWAHQTSLPPSLVFSPIEVPLASQESERSCICVLEVSNLLHFFVFWYLILELFRQCGTCLYLFSFYCSFIYAITFNIFQNTPKRQELFDLKRDSFVCSKLWLVN